MTTVKDLQPGSKASALIRRVGRTALAERLIEAEDRILVSVSGGPDSVALLTILSLLAPRHRLTLRVVHFNHGLRGAEADGDERFVAALCDQLHIPYCSERLDLSMEKRRRRSIQELAREQRYAVLLRLAKELGVNKVALGHTLDDQAETVLMWMLRGAGTSGLAGIPARRPPMFIRPLLGVRRTDIVAYLAEMDLTFRMDSTNAKRLYFRNRIRHELLPVLEALRPGAARVLARQAEILHEEDRCLDQWTSGELPQLTTRVADDEEQLARNRLLTLPVAIQRRIVRQLISMVGGVTSPPPFGSVAAVLERVIHGRSGAALTVQGVRVVREYETIRFRRFRRESQPVLPPHLCIKASVPSIIQWPPTGQRLVLREGRKHTAEIAEKGEFDTPGNKKYFPANRAVLDADRFTMDLTLRSWRPGDTFQPLGMHGKRKKLQDLFVDLKIPRQTRAQTPLLIAPEGILWVVGHRIDHRFRVTTATRRILLVQLIAQADKAG
jgi:tRNA(Ile)-lysidine synthase